MMHPTVFFIIKVLVSGLMIALISSLAKTFPKWAALLTALPVMTFLSLIWIYIEEKNLELLEVYTRDVFLWIFPSLPFFVIAMVLFRYRVPFVWTLSLSTLGLAIGLYFFEKLSFFR